jgi:alpha-ribazole phosphatase
LPDISNCQNQGPADMQMTPLEDITSWWWVRHAPVVGYDGIIYGSQDVPADTSDEEAYQSLAKGLPDDAIWVTSHLKRTHVTADAIGQAGLKQPERLIEQGLGEQNFGNWQDMTYAQQDADWRARYGAESMHKFWYCPADHRPEGGESFVDMINRVSEVINRMNETHRGRNIVAVAHGGTIRAALALALALDPDRAFSFQTENLSTTRIDHVRGPGTGGDWRVAFINKRAGNKAPASRQIA